MFYRVAKIKPHNPPQPDRILNMHRPVQPVQRHAGLAHIASPLGIQLASRAHRQANRITRGDSADGKDHHGYAQQRGNHQQQASDNISAHVPLSHGPVLFPCHSRQSGNPLISHATYTFALPSVRTTQADQAQAYGFSRFQNAYPKSIAKAL